jgi:hypothetical protein
MVSIGPSGDESDAEIDEAPSPEDVRATVEWAVKTDNIEMADFDFEVDGEVEPHLQLLNDLTYNLTKMTDVRLDATRNVLQGYETEEDELEPTHLAVTVDATIEEHQNIVQELLDEVYDASLADVEEIRRSTVAVVDDVEYGHVDELASDPAEFRAETEYIGYRDGETGGYVDLGEEINLNAVAIGLGLENIEYEPERFPAVVYRYDHPEARVLIFDDGQIVTVDADNGEAARGAIVGAVERLRDVELYEGEVPAESEVEVSATSK